MLSPLTLKLSQEIREHGPISFERFMDVALYEPGLGYYRNERDPFGRDGDFYTAEQLQPVFGELVNTFVGRVAARHVASRESFSVVELGAGRGEMREALRDWDYMAVDFDRGMLPADLHGVILANEFFDALPVRLLQLEGGWQELCVAESGGRFCFVPRPLGSDGAGEEAELDRQLQAYAERYGEPIGQGGQLEVSVRTSDWLDRLGATLRAGYLVVIDYGYSAKELIRLAHGTAASYRSPRLVEDILSQPGEQDITVHVNFTYLTEAAAHAGFQLVSRQSLAAWAMSVWDARELKRRWKGGRESWRLQWKQIVYGMGETFQVLLFERTGKNTG
jgi:SAM-dependent MidA family methyltransferase